LDPDASSPADLDAWKALVASQGGLGSILTRGIDLGVTIKDPEVRFTRSGEIIVRGSGKIGPLTVPARAKVRPYIANDDLAFDVIETQLGRLSLPDSAAQLLSSGLEKAILAGRNVASVTRIDVTEGSLRFAGNVENSG
ncbi:MAG: hypothetical protein KDB69_06355, partial [Acidimicrobiia bacterium]|nr:hypothetical protein [Acidimicrobiia bacterium]